MLIENPVDPVTESLLEESEQKIHTAEIIKIDLDLLIEKSKLDCPTLAQNLGDKSGKDHVLSYEDGEADASLSLIFEAHCNPRR